MPQMPGFDAGNLSLRPTEVGVEATAATARRIGGFFNQQASATEMLARETERLGGQTQQLGRETEQLGATKGSEVSDVGRRLGSSIADAGDAAVKYMDHKQISQGSVAYSNILQQATQQWNDTLNKADPNDPTVASKFMDSLNETIGKFQGDGFYTENSQKWAEAHAEALRQHFAEKTIAGMSQLAGEAVKVNSQQSLNALSATVHSDPSSIDLALASWKSTLEGTISTSPNLGGNAASVRMELGQKGAESIVKSAAIGYITQNAALPPWISDPKYAPYVNGAELKQFESAAKTEAKKNELTQKQIDLVAKQKADLNVHQGAAKITTDNISFDPQSGQPILDPKFFAQALDLARKNPDASNAAETVRTMFSWGQSQQNKALKPVDDPTVKRDLTDRLFDPENPTSRIDLMKAQSEGKLSNQSFQSMNRLVTELERTPLKGDIWKSVTTAVKDRLIRTDLPEGRDAIGAANYSSFIQSFLPQYIEKSRAGTLPDDALNLNDPKSMISQAIAPYKSSLQDRLRANASQPAPAAQPAATTKPEAIEPPASLKGIGSLEYSAKRQQYRDTATNKIYNKDGSEVSQ